MKRPYEENETCVDTVGADAYPKGTGSTSRSYLAVCRWRRRPVAQVTITAQGRGVW